MISVACDICGQNYEFADHLAGKLQKCRECDTRFEVSEANAPFEPDAEEDPAAESDFAGVWRIFRGMAAGIAILAACGWMTALLFYDPWQRPPLEFSARGNPSRRAMSSSAPPAISQPTIVPSAPQPVLAPPANPSDAATAPSAARALLEQQRAEFDKRVEEARQRIQNRMRSAPFVPPPAPGPAGPGQPPNPRPSGASGRP